MDGAVEDGRVHPGPVLVEADGNFVSLVVTRREWEVAGGVGDLTEPLIVQIESVGNTKLQKSVPVVPAIFEDEDDEGI
jgi:hypothetical protein